MRHVHFETRGICCQLTAVNTGTAADHIYMALLVQRQPTHYSIAYRWCRGVDEYLWPTKAYFRPPQGPTLALITLLPKAPNEIFAMGAKCRLSKEPSNKLVAVHLVDFLSAQAASATRRHRGLNKFTVSCGRLLVVDLEVNSALWLEVKLMTGNTRADRVSKLPIRTEIRGDNIPKDFSRQSFHL